MYVCMCVDVYICVHVCVYEHVHGCMCTYVCANGMAGRLLACTHTYTHTCTHRRTHTHTHTRRQHCLMVMYMGKQYVTMISCIQWVCMIREVWWVYVRAQMCVCVHTCMCVWGYDFKQWWLVLMTTERNLATHSSPHLRTHIQHRLNREGQKERKMKGYKPVRWLTDNG